MKYLIVLIILLNVSWSTTISAQMPVRKGPAAPEEIKKAREMLDKNFHDPVAHKKFMLAMGITNPELILQYRKWVKEYPDNLTIPLAIGTFFYNAEMPQGREFLLKAAEIDPGNAKIWSMLSVDATVRGEEELSQEYIKKAILADTSNMTYKMAYILSYRDKNYNDFEQKISEFIKRYPDNRDGARLLYNLAKGAKDLNVKIRYFEELRHLYSPQKFPFSASGTEQLVDIYMQSDAEKALAIIKESGSDEDWEMRRQVAEKLILISKLEADKKYSSAIVEINKVVLPRNNYMSDFIAVKRSSLLDKVGNTSAAYDSLIMKMAVMPSDQLYEALGNYGRKIGKSNSLVDKDIETIRKNMAVPAPSFDLGLYTHAGNLKLEALKGKVTLLTFWFPYCSPCRAEFPYFQNVINKFSDNQVAYLGINIFPEQDDFVLQFLENYKYSFIPLRGSLEFADKYFGVNSAPQNFLIDKQGQIVFKNFRIDEDNERTLELMISALLKENS